MNPTEGAFQPPAPDAAANGHDVKGRFAPGNAGGPGNPFARRVAELRQIMLDCVTDKDMEIIVGELVVQAQNGKLAAIKLLFQYVLGKPAATVNPDTLDLQEVEQYRQAPEPAVLKDIVGARVPADYACTVLRSVLPYVGDALVDLTVATLRGSQPEAVEPVMEPAPSPNGDFDADEPRRRSSPPPNSGGSRPAPNRDARTAPPMPFGA